MNGSKKRQPSVHGRRRACCVKTPVHKIVSGKMSQYRGLGGGKVRCREVLECLCINVETNWTKSISKPMCWNYSTSCILKVFQMHLSRGQFFFNHSTNHTQVLPSLHIDLCMYTRVWSNTETEETWLIKMSGYGVLGPRWACTTATKQVAAINHHTVRPGTNPDTLCLPSHYPELDSQLPRGLYAHSRFNTRVQYIYTLTAY